MAKQPTLRYRCAACSYLSLTPVGRCPSCGAWGTLEPEETAPVRLPSPSRGRSKPIALPDAPPETRVSSGLEELDRVLGGGWLAGGVVLLGGEPGVGKSTLLLQSCCAMAEEGQRVLYVSGEESTSQLALRARRLGLKTRSLSLLCTDDVTEALEEADPYAFVVFDSVQALKDPESTGWPGSPHQVRSVAERVLAFSKGRRVPTVLVGHITKQGQIAGPKLLEHLTSGENLALVTDAGTPGISDPGYSLVHAAIERDLEFSALPGASASIMALTLSGLPAHSFTFRGFPPNRAGARRHFLQADAGSTYTLVYYESPYRLAAFLRDALEVFGDRQASVSNDLTKKFERIYRGSLTDLNQLFAGEPIRGEYVVCIAGLDVKAIKKPAD